MNKPTFRLFLIALAAFLALTGCSKDATVKEPAPGASGSTAGEDPKTGQPSLPLSAVPDEVKLSGYAYYGLEKTGPVEFEVVMPNDPTPQTGTSTTRLIKAENGEAVFLTERTGPLQQLGSEELVAKKDGIYNTRIGGQAVEPPQLVMPADLTVGKAWTTQGKITLPDGQTFEQKMSLKAVAMEKVKTKAGEFDALKVTAAGETKFQGKTSKSNITAWYVKGLGAVKMIIETSEPKGKMTVEATKI
jgi:hypothetical protein